jgi:hypothetical protein
MTSLHSARQSFGASIVVGRDSAVAQDRGVVLGKSRRPASTAPRISTRAKGIIIVSVLGVSGRVGMRRSLQQDVERPRFNNVSS